jgi:hypothetical protein
MLSIRAGLLSFSLMALFLTQGLTQTVPPPKPNTGIRGTVESIMKGSISITSTLGTIQTKLGPGTTFYKNVPANLSQVTSKSFIGVTTITQPDGTQKATEIHIFDDSLRGAGEGSRLIGQPAAGTSKSRMTNGTVTQSRMTNGKVTQSRMTNGTVQKKMGDSTMVVQYDGGMQNVTIPPDVKVSAIIPTQDRPAVGQSVSFFPERKADSPYTTAKIIMITAAPSAK